jgi:hypothetical protein
MYGKTHKTKKYRSEMLYIHDDIAKNRSNGSLGLPIGTGTLAAPLK